MAPVVATAAPVGAAVAPAARVFAAVVPVAPAVESEENRRGEPAQGQHARPDRRLHGGSSIGARL